MIYRAGRVPIHPEAFSRDLRSRGKHPRARSGQHLTFIRTLPCLICGSRRNTQAAHIRAANPIYGKRHTGLGEKPSDRFCLPCCSDCHHEQHQGNELAFWQAHGIDPFQVAAALFACSGDEEAAELVIRMARAKE